MEIADSFTCCICGRFVIGKWGNNPFPVDDTQGAKCCDYCNTYYVIPERIERLNKESDKVW